MGNIASIKSEIAEIKTRINEISNNITDGDFVPASELLSITNRVNELELEVRDIELGALKSQIQALVGNQSSVVNHTQYSNSGVNIRKHQTVPGNNIFGREKTHNNQYNQNQFKKKSRISEVDVGKYLVGVLASVLILLALVMFVGTIWEYMGPAIKFLMIMMLGCGITGLGTYKIIIQNKGNGFWTSVTSCGTGITFIDIISGMLIWNLYGFGITAILMLAWFIGCVILARKAQSLTFFTVSHIGAIISLVLAAAHLGDMSQTVNQFILSIIAIGWIVISEVGQYGINDFTLKERLSLLSKIFFTAVLMILTVNNDRPFDTHWQDGVLWIEPFLFVIVAIGIVLLYKAQKYKNTVAGAIGKVIFTHISVIYILIAMQSTVTQGLLVDMNINNAWVISAVAIAIIVLTGLAAKTDIWRLLLETSSIIAVLLVIISEGTIESPALLLLLAATAGVMYVDLLNNKEYTKIKIISTIFYCFAIPFILFDEEYGDNLYEKLVLIDMALVYIVGIVDFIYHYKLKPNNKFGAVAHCITITSLMITTYVVTDRLNGEFIWVLFISALLLIGYRIGIMNKMLEKLDNTERILPSILFLGIQFIIHAITYIGCLDAYNSFDGILLGTILIALSIMNLYNSIYFKHNLRSIVAVIMCNINIFVVSELWTSGNIVMMTSLVGVMVSALLIVAGFIWKHKTFRILGLITMMMYVLKISFFDAAVVSGDGISIVMILLGGLICFAISFVYNTLDKTFNKQE